MKLKPTQLMLTKVALLFLPFFILFIIFMCIEKTPATLQYETLDEKIKRLVVDNPSHPYVLVTGESRAAKMFMPNVFDDITKQSSANVAVDGVTLPTAVTALGQNGLLDGKHFIVISVSSFEINDNYMSYYPSDFDVIMSEKWGRQKIKHALKYAVSFIWYYLENYREFLRFWNHPETGISSDVIARGGYMLNPGQINVNPDGTTNDIDYTEYTSPKLDGVKKVEFEKSVVVLCESNVPALIYLGPIAPAWRKSMTSIGADKVESEFSQIITDALKPKKCGNVHFVDFSKGKIDSLDNSQFTDFIHLNTSGAKISSQLLAETMIKNGYFKKAPTPSPAQSK